MQPRVRGPVVVVSLLVAGLVTGCASSDDTDITTSAPSLSSAPTTTASAPTSASPTQAPTSEAPTSTPPTSAAPASTPATTPAATVPTTVPPTKAAGPSKGLRTARRDVATIAPQLESYYRDREYPVDLAQVRQTVEGAGVQLQPGNSIGGYVYDGDAVEFTLCIENTSGAWATYDTAPMTLQRSGETGGCP